MIQQVSQILENPDFKMFHESPSHIYAAALRHSNLEAHLGKAIITIQELSEDPEFKPLTFGQITRDSLGKSDPRSYLRKLIKYSAK